MDEFFRQFDSYCERTDLTYWSEPLNALSNLAFIVAAVILWRRTAGMPLARTLCAILSVIGIGSYLFHTHATVWAVILDVVPIGVFVLVYVFLANYRYWSLPLWTALGATALFFPYSYLVVQGLDDLPFFRISAAYWPLPILIAAYGIALLRRHPDTGRGLLIGAALLVVSLTFRSLDAVACDAVPTGTHFAWHLLNAIMLGWMIEVYRRHLLAKAQARR